MNESFFGLCDDYTAHIQKHIYIYTFTNFNKSSFTENTKLIKSCNQNTYMCINKTNACIIINL